MLYESSSTTAPLPPEPNLYVQAGKTTTKNVNQVWASAGKVEPDGRPVAASCTYDGPDTLVLRTTVSKCAVNALKTIPTQPPVPASN